MMNTLTADELGAKGEARFAELCSDSQLVCNPSSRDRYGWDYVVEFPFADPTGETSLDKRPAPLTCAVQVKTISSTSKRVAMKLSAAERLAKSLHPAFVCVLVVDKALAVIEGRLIHFRGANLERVLKGLRQAQLQRKQPNKISLSFDPRRDGTTFQLTPGSLREALQHECGGDLHAYIQAKIDELANAGFDDGRYYVKATLRARDEEDFIEAFLGTRPIEATEIHHSEVRFGIELPLDLDGPKGVSELHISPQAGNKCSVLTRHPDYAEPASLGGELVIVPEELSADRRMRLTTEFFIIDMFTRDGVLKFRTRPEVKTSASHSLASWRNFFCFLSSIADNRATLEVKPDDGRQGFSVSLNQMQERDRLLGFQHLVRVCDIASRLINLANMASPNLTYVDILDSAEALIDADAIVSERTDALKFAWPSQVEASIDERSSYVCVDFVLLGEATIAIGALATLATQELQGRRVLVPAEVRFLRAAPIQRNVAAYNAFREELNALTKVETTIQREMVTTEDVPAAAEATVS